MVAELESLDRAPRLSHHVNHRANGATHSVTIVPRPRTAGEEGERIAPDGGFVREIIRLGGSSLKRCFQCGACTAVCRLGQSPSQQGFPRKQIIEAQWGLRNRLLSDPAPWLCHDCGSCSANCPRGGEPGAIIAALRASAILHYAFPGFLARFFATSRLLPLVLLVPTILLLSVLALSGHLVSPYDPRAGEPLPAVFLQVTTLLALGFALIASGVGLYRFSRAIKLPPLAGQGVDGPGAMLAVSHPSRGIAAGFAASMLEILTHRNFERNGRRRAAYLGHLLLFYGTPFLLLSAVILAGYRFSGRTGTLPLDDPAKIAGNLGALMVFAGINVLAFDRLARSNKAFGRGTYFDWFFVGLIYFTSLTGIVLELARLASLNPLAYVASLVHIVLAFTLVVSAPYSKFAHVLYRTVALAQAKYRARGATGQFFILMVIAVATGVGIIAGLLGLATAVAAWTGAGEAVLQALRSLTAVPIAHTLHSYSQVYLPIANVSVNLLLLVGLGMGVGCLSGLFGVGGGFLMTPLLMMVGIPPAAAAASDSCQISGAAASGAYAHSRLGNVDVKLGLTILAGGLVGGTAGVQVVAALRAMGNFDFVVKITYVLVLGIVGVLMVRESAATLLKNWMFTIRQQTILSLIGDGYVELKGKLVVPVEPIYRPFVSVMNRLPFQTYFPKAEMKTSVLFPFILGSLVGFLAAIMGVGGGFIMVPAMIYVLGVKTKIAVGTDLLQMVFTSVNVTFQQAITNRTVDLSLALLLLVGSAVGAQLGARMSRRLNGHQLRILLGLIVLIVTIKLLLEITLPPDTYITLSTAGGGH